MDPVLHVWKFLSWPTFPHIPLPAQGSLSRVRICRPDAFRGAHGAERHRAECFPAEKRGNLISSYHSRRFRPRLCLIYRITGCYLPRAWFLSAVLFVSDLNRFDSLLIPREKSRFPGTVRPSAVRFRVGTLRWRSLLSQWNYFIAIFVLHFRLTEKINNYSALKN